MPATLTAAEFSKYLNTTFHVANHQPVDLELTHVKSYLSKEHEEAGMERFSAFFFGPENGYLPQGIYSLEHEAMGAFDLFLVPIATNQKGFQYEAVFNYYKQP
jgi:Domain of unknown function (DUF6916)